MNIVRLRTDYMENPVGFDFVRPSLGWVTEAEGINKCQSAYQLQVARDDGFEALCLDTSKLLSDQSVSVRLEMPLEARTRYFWRVRIWDEQDAVSEFSETAFFETGRYDEPWAAKWIGGPVIGGEEAFPALRKTFACGKRVRKARLYASGVGMYCLFINGQPVTDEVLLPNFNAYDSWIQYQTFDVTPLLTRGENAVGGWLGNGYYKGRVNFPERPERRNIYGDRLGLIAEIVMEYDDGTEERVVTDGSWRVSESPFLRAEIYDGEVYDARREQRGWSDATFDDSAWGRASIIPIDQKLLTARCSVPVKVVERLAPVALIQTPLGERVLDFGQNFAGWIRFETSAPEGTELLFQFGEALDKDGNFYRDNMRTALAELRYTASGGQQSFAPTFTFFGFRYVRVTGWPGEINMADFTGEVVHSVMERTGSFTCSDERVNRLFLNALWGQRSNFVDTPTDCPQRDERLGWTGDAQVFCATACMNMESDAFYRKYLYDLWKEQQKVGYVPVVVPNILYGLPFWNMTTTGWGDAATIIPWTLYLYFGDIAILEAQYDSMRAWVDYMRQADLDGVNRYGGQHLGDWLAQDTKDPDSVFGLTPTDLIATAYYAYSTMILAKAAKRIGKEEDAAYYTELAGRIREAFRDEYVSANGRVVSETQTAQLLPLHMDLVLPEQRGTVIRHLAERIRIDKVLLNTGFLGTPYLCPVLSENGLNEYAYALLLSTECPSWLYAVERGATTIWERWNSVKEDGSFGPVSMNSLNHYAFGSIAEWMYRYAAGINPVEEAPGFKRIRIAPMPNDCLQYVDCSIRTQYGMLRSAWSLDSGRIVLEFEIPFNTTAEIHLPDAEDVADILENGMSVHGNTFFRGSGKWRYSYIYNGWTIPKRVPEVEMLNI